MGPPHRDVASHRGELLFRQSKWVGLSASSPRNTISTVDKVPRFDRTYMYRVLSSKFERGLVVLSIFFKSVLLLISLIALAWLLNASFLVSSIDNHETRLLAHRGVHHVYVGKDRSDDSCLAAPVEPITHAFIENMIPCMKKAFDYGAPPTRFAM